MCRWLVVLTLAVMSATAQAQPSAPSRLSAATDYSAAATSYAERQVAQLTAAREALEQRYNEEVDAIDRLKRQRPSWRRDREIRDSLSTSLETSNQLDARTAELKKATAKLDSARRAYLRAIADELGAGPPAPRAQHLERVRVQVGAQLKDPGGPRHIMIPDLEIDPLADPEELDQRAAELRASEQLLTRQLAGLDAQATELQRTAQLRKHNDRAVDLVARYEDSPQRRATHNPETAEPGDGQGPSQIPQSDAPIATVEPAPSAPISDVAETPGDALANSRSATPAQRAEAARKAHHVVARRLELVRNRRIEIENRARQLRSNR
jgi:hypothetical protein